AWLERRGLAALSPESALRALGQLLTAGWVHGVVERVDWPRFRAVYEAQRPRPLLREMPGAAVATKSEERADPSELDALKALDAPAKKSRVLAWMRAAVAQLLETTSDAVDV